ncbi:hypothetical protein FRB96_003987 [Tulasnella sp. 330]|nr:hypothetical protein FRB96_003987 [Tulasnella sp. 330]KAG8882613.1 hypothetical protein FRB97_008040 [Tulasnella sp. 331]KAG8888883.1 hypothetical protein FRB98_006548 [Tulasnella sp. 332]
MAPTTTASTADGTQTSMPEPAPLARNRVLLDVFFFVCFAILACVLAMTICRQKGRKRRKASTPINSPNLGSVMQTVSNATCPPSPASTLVDHAPSNLEDDGGTIPLSTAIPSHPRPKLWAIALQRSSKQLRRLHAHFFREETTADASERGPPNQTVTTSSFSTSLYRHHHRPRAGPLTTSFVLRIQDPRDSAPPPETPPVIPVDDNGRGSLLSYCTAETDVRIPILFDENVDTSSEGSRSPWPSLRTLPRSSPPPPPPPQSRRETFTCSRGVGSISPPNQQLLSSMVDCLNTALEVSGNQHVAFAESERHARTKSYGELLEALSLEPKAASVSNDGDKSIHDHDGGHDERGSRDQFQAEIKAFSEEFGKRLQGLSWSSVEPGSMTQGKSVMAFEDGGERASPVMKSPTFSARLSARALVISMDELHQQIQREQHNRRI